MTFRAPIYTRTDARPRPAELLTWIETLPPGVLSRTIPLRQADWPNPVRRVNNPALYSVSYSQQLQPVTTRPFVQSDWPSPIRRTHNVELRTFLGELIADYTGTPLVPFDWPNPVRRVSNPSLYSITSSPQIPQPAVAINPFVQADWPSPQQRKPNPDLRTWVNQPPWSLTVGAPFAQDDWPNPVRRTDSRELRTWVESLNVASIGAPFSQTDWPNPIRRVDSVSLRICVNGFQLLAQPQAPVATGTIPDISQLQNTGTFQYDLSLYFSGATSYAIAPAIEAGWTFDTGTAVLVIDTDEIGQFGPFTVTATNVNGSTPSNAFNVAVAVAPVVETGFSGGLLLDYEREQARRARERRKRREREEEAERIEEATTREIAALLREQEAKDARRAELARLAHLVARHAGRSNQGELSERIEKAVSKAATKQTAWSLYALERELARAQEEEEFILLALRTALDD